VNTKIKLVIFIVAGLAIFSTVYFVDALRSSFSKYAVLGLATKTASPLPNPSNDPDKDGLDNSQEAYWNTDYLNPDTDSDGYSDGEEIITGHDPRKEGPDDLLPGAKQNLTKRSTDILASGLVAGAFDPKSPDYEKSVSSFIDDLIYQATINTEDLDLESSNLIVADATTENKKEYKARVKPNLGKISGQSLDSFQKIAKSAKEALKAPNLNDTEFMRLINEEEEKIKLNIEELKAMPVPKDMLHGHQKVIFGLQDNLKYYESLKHIADDPLQTIYADFNFMVNYMRLLLEIRSINGASTQTF